MCEFSCDFQDKRSNNRLLLFRTTVHVQYIQYKLVHASSVTMLRAVVLLTVFVIYVQSKSLNNNVFSADPIVICDKSVKPEDPEQCMTSVSFKHFKLVISCLS